VREHAIFEREGSNLSCEVPISFTTAALGGTVEVPTLDGEVVLKIPPKRSPGGCFACARRASCRCAAARRRPVLPRGDRDSGRLGAEQKELLRKFEASLSAGQP
jgi:molecular chaperone DnaJ